MEDDTGLRPVLVGHGRTSEDLWAMVAEAKGATDSSLKWANERTDEDCIEVGPRGGDQGFEASSRCQKLGRHCDDRVVGPRFKVRRKRRESGEGLGCASQNCQTSPRVDDQSQGAENIGPDDVVGRLVGG